jgi:hypothetical protein
MVLADTHTLTLSLVRERASEGYRSMVCFDSGLIFGHRIVWEKG